ncbi:hypothetical protein [Nocardia heshunensis]
MLEPVFHLVFFEPRIFRHTTTTIGARPDTDDHPDLMTTRVIHGEPSRRQAGFAGPGIALSGLITAEPTSVVGF